MFLYIEFAVAANRLTEREDVGAAAQATERGEGLKHCFHLKTIPNMLHPQG